MMYWVALCAVEWQGREARAAQRQAWRDYGKAVIEVSHEFNGATSTEDPVGTLVEWTYPTRVLTTDDRDEAERLLADDSPATEPDYEGVIYKSPLREAAAIRT